MANGVSQNFLLVPGFAEIKEITIYTQLKKGYYYNRHLQSFAKFIAGKMSALGRFMTHFQASIKTTVAGF